MEQPICLLLIMESPSKLFSHGLFLETFSLLQPNQARRLGHSSTHGVYVPLLLPLSGLV